MRPTESVSTPPASVISRVELVLQATIVLAVAWAAEPDLVATGWPSDFSETAGAVAVVASGWPSDFSVTAGTVAVMA